MKKVLFMVVTLIIITTFSLKATAPVMISVPCAEGSKFTHRWIIYDDSNSNGSTNYYTAIKRS
jgi:hypothetical protein